MAAQNGAPSGNGLRALSTRRGAPWRPRVGRLATGRRLGSLNLQLLEERNRGCTAELGSPFPPRRLCSGIKRGGGSLTERGKGRRLFLALWPGRKCLFARQGEENLFVFKGQR